MCLYIDDDGDGTFLGEGIRKARKEHVCMECGRFIEPGEDYRYWSWVDGGYAHTSKMCGHCQAAIDLGHALTGCPKQWNATLLYDRDPEMGYLANCAWREEHPDLQGRDRIALLRALVAGGRRGWRWPDGTLMEPPAVPESVSP